MPRIPLIASCLFLVTTIASAEPKVTVRVSVDGPSVTVSGATAEDLKTGKLERMLSEAVNQARRVWRCDLARKCNGRPVPKWAKPDG